MYVKSKACQWRRQVMSLAAALFTPRLGQHTAVHNAVEKKERVYFGRFISDPFWLGARHKRNLICFVFDFLNNTCSSVNRAVLFNQFPHSSQGVEQRLRFLHAVEIEVNQHIVGFVNGLSDSMPADTRLFTSTGIKVENAPPSFKIGNWVLDVQGDHLGAFPFEQARYIADVRQSTVSIKSRAQLMATV